MVDDLSKIMKCLDVDVEITFQKRRMVSIDFKKWQNKLKDLKHLRR